MQYSDRDYWFARGQSPTRTFNWLRWFLYILCSSHDWIVPIWYTTIAAGFDGQSTRNKERTATMKTINMGWTEWNQDCLNRQNGNLPRGCLSATANRQRDERTPANTANLRATIHDDRPGQHEEFNLAKRARFFDCLHWFATSSLAITRVPFSAARWSVC